MSKFIPRKIKKACKAYRNDVSLKTKWLRYVSTQVLGRVDDYKRYDGEIYTYYETKYGKLLDEYIDYEQRRRN
jgi:hypothetical protein|nr:MAG TPA: hypothetical protein [Caudoviricetes sp.]